MILILNTVQKDWSKPRQKNVYSVITALWNLLRNSPLPLDTIQYTHSTTIPWCECNIVYLGCVHLAHLVELPPSRCSLLSEYCNKLTPGCTNDTFNTMKYLFVGCFAKLCTLEEHEMVQRTSLMLIDSLRKNITSIQSVKTFLFLQPYQWLGLFRATNLI